MCQLCQLVSSAMPYGLCWQASSMKHIVSLTARLGADARSEPLHGKNSSFHTLPSLLLLFVSFNTL